MPMSVSTRAGRHIISVDRRAEPRQTLVHEVDLSYLIVPWSFRLRNGEAFRKAFGDHVGYRYHWLPDGDQSFKPRKSSGRTQEENWAEGVEVIAEFIDGR